MLDSVSRKSSGRVRRRVGRAASALTVVAVTAFGPSGPGLLTVAHVRAVGTVTQSAEAVVPAAVEVPGAGIAPLPDAAVAADVGAALPGVALPGMTLPGAAVVGTPTLATTPATATATIVPPSAPSGSGIPGTVLAAYRNAEASLAASNPGCHVSWSLIAGIGRVESGHASGGRVDAAGTTRGRILGPELNGNGTAVIHDTDGGAMDGDTVFDRAVGPMQFIPGTWRSYAKDGNRDGVASPHNVYDAALAAGAYLCAGGGDLSQPAAQRAALLRYNRSDAYGALVLRWAAAYAGGVAVLPNEQGEVPTTTPTPPAQVPVPAGGTIDPATSAALAAPAPAVTGTVASESSADGAKTTTTTTTTTKPTTSTTTTPPTSTTPPTTTTTPPAGTSTAPTSSAPTTTTTTAPPVTTTISPAGAAGATTTKTTATKTTTTSTRTSTPTTTTTTKSTPTTTTSSSTATKTTSSSATKTSTSKTATSTTKTSSATTSTKSAAKTTADSGNSDSTSSDSSSDGS
jgi:membrane-bound lytic murein transglycosylase B